MNKTILLTFDIEEWYDTTFLTEYIPRDMMSIKRLHANIDFPLQLLQEHNVPATFFVLGTIARDRPDIVKKIIASDPRHEIASHSFFHELLFDQPAKRIKDNVERSKQLLEDVTGKKVSGFRAPYFSINDYAIEALQQAGYSYDSSLHDFRLNKQYGHLSMPMEATVQPGIFRYRELHEITIPVKRYFGDLLKLPFGGGGYLRLYPLRMQLHLINSFLKTSNYFLLYMHPWEFDSEQPYISNAPFLKRQRHYLGIKGHYQKVGTMIKALQAKGYEFSTLSSYLKTI